MTNDSVRQYFDSLEKLDAASKVFHEATEGVCHHLEALQEENNRLRILLTNEKRRKYILDNLSVEIVQRLFDEIDSHYGLYRFKENFVICDPVLPVQSGPASAESPA